MSNLNKIALLQTTKLLTIVVEALYSLYKLFGEGKYSIYCLNISLDCLGTPSHMYTKPIQVYRRYKESVEKLKTILVLEKDLF